MIFEAISLPGDCYTGAPTGSEAVYHARLTLSVAVRCQQLAEVYAVDPAQILAAALEAMIYRYAGVLAEPNAPSLRVLIKGERSRSDAARYERRSKLIVAMETGNDTSSQAHLALGISAGNPSALAWRYQKAVFDEAAVARIHDHFSRLLEGALAEPERPISELAMMGEREQEQLLNDWNRTSIDYPRNASIPELFESMAAENLDRMAVTDRSLALTYRELNEEANQLCRFLAERGVTAGSRVGIALERSTAMIVAMVAILKAGGAYVPLDVTYPLERIQFMISDTDLTAIVTDSRRKSQLPSGGPAIVCVDEDQARIRQGSRTNVESRSTAESTAYVMFTSGSTGTPKGAAIPHRGVVRLVKNATYVDFGPSEVFAQVSNASFDAITFEVWGALLNGGKLVIVPQEVLLSPHRFAEAIQEQGLTAMFLTAALFNVIAAKCPDAFRSVHHLLVGGDAVDPTWARRVLQAGAPRRMINGYGPTEGTTFSVTHWIDHVPEHATTVPIGRPLSNSQAYILDHNLDPVPVGVLGELYLGGDGLAHGYWNRPELTAERFVSSPFDSGGRARLYKTGDLARYRNDGVIECLGRSDRQVKIRGFRIELGEIEVFLREHPQVTDCALTVERDDAGAKQLAAYIATDATPPPSPMAIRQFLRGKLPEFMLPSAITLMRSLPLTPNGKIDRSKLAATQVLPATAATGQRIPASGLEQVIAGIWREVLGKSDFGVDDNFFDLGGNSLQLVALESRLRSHFPASLTITELFEYTTVRAIAARLTEMPRESAAVTESQLRAQKQRAAFGKARPIVLR
jgi:amino acid adenylation domain-containing protein